MIWQECLEWPNQFSFYHHSSSVGSWIRVASSRADVIGPLLLPNAGQAVHVQETWRQTEPQNSQKAAPHSSSPSKESTVHHHFQWFSCLSCSGKRLLHFSLQRRQICSQVSVKALVRDVFSHSQVTDETQLQVLDIFIPLADINSYLQLTEAVGQIW